MITLQGIVKISIQRRRKRNSVIIIPLARWSFKTTAIKVLPLRPSPGKPVFRKKKTPYKPPATCFPTRFISSDKKKKKIRSSIKLLLVRLHVHVTLQLGARRPQLETELAVRSAPVQLVEALHAAVLHRVLETGSEVRNELVNRSGMQLVTRTRRNHCESTYPR